MPSNTIKAITVDQSDAGRLAVRSRNLAPAAPGEITIRVTAISLNRGETKRGLTITETGTCPGWDFAGAVEETGETQGAPDVGSRVVGVLPIGAWAERVHAPLNSIAVIPEGVTDAQAACLPVAGLTALHALRKGGLLLGRKVLVDGVSGGVGQFRDSARCRFRGTSLFACPTTRAALSRRSIKHRRRRGGRNA